MTCATVIDCLSCLFCILGFPCCIRSDRGAPFVNCETRNFLTTRGINFSTSTPYHLQGNIQCEHVNQTVWRTLKLLLHGRQLPEDRWEKVSPTLCTRSDHLFAWSQMNRPMSVCFFSRARTWWALPCLRGCWIQDLLLRRFVRNKSDSLCDPVQLLEANQTYSVIRHADGRGSAVSTSDLAPHPQDSSPVSREDASEGLTWTATTMLTHAVCFLKTIFPCLRRGRTSLLRQRMSPREYLWDDRPEHSGRWPLGRMRRYPIEFYMEILWEFTY